MAVPQRHCRHRCWTIASARAVAIEISVDCQYQRYEGRNQQTPSFSAERQNPSLIVTIPVSVQPVVNIVRVRGHSGTRIEPLLYSDEIGANPCEVPVNSDLRYLLAQKCVIMGWQHVPESCSMRHVISSVLIPLILACQGLSGGHAHFEKSSGQLHSASPHFHITGSHSHGLDHSHSSHHNHNKSDHESGASWGHIGSATDHDADAYYLGDSLSLREQRSERLNSNKQLAFGLVVVCLTATTEIASRSNQIWRASHFPGSSARIPLFLRDRSIRC